MVALLIEWANGDATATLLGPLLVDHAEDILRTQGDHLHHAEDVLQRSPPIALKKCIELNTVFIDDQIRKYIDFNNLPKNIIAG